MILQGGGYFLIFFFIKFTLSQETCKEFLIYSDFETCEPFEMMMIRRKTEQIFIQTICEHEGTWQCGRTNCEKDDLENGYCYFALFDHFVFNPCCIQCNVQYVDAHLKYVQADFQSTIRSWEITTYNFDIIAIGSNITINGVLYQNVLNESFEELFISFILKYNPNNCSTCESPLWIYVNGQLVLIHNDTNLAIYDEGNPYPIFTFLNITNTVIEAFSAHTLIPPEDQIMELYYLTMEGSRTVEYEVCITEGAPGDCSGSQIAAIILGAILGILLLLFLGLIIWWLYRWGVSSTTPEKYTQLTEMEEY